ncbi:efflux RND transporter permease subunit [Alkaliphilus peptidifermentans]|uniref:AcrB/AcrD/AcrF family protein n=1 Tax=Alkaliphilus peptidifermentans DSM 18978 TaxID=1120976 RepID=A0A1G5F379_9FIRM|nr:efflux RND transporter permease subunit [Alkaliphilus peptidifermentans]SCY33672.1 AcrB/AcrD/AcrF family protein [Alkaliphilus peptidifermentans DSM 18978]
MKISQIAISRPVTVMMMVMMIIVLGVVSLVGLNLDFFPDIAFPMAVVITNYDGVGPQEIESIITKPLEQVMGTVDNFKKVSSVSSNGQSMVMVEFTQGTNMDYAALQMREKVDMVKGMWSNDVADPMIFQYDMSMIPIIQLGMSYGDDLAGLKTLAEDKVKDRLERIKGVAAVDIYGGLDEEIKIDIIPHKLQGYDLSLTQVAQALRMENLNLPGGLLNEGKYQYTIRTTGEFSNIDEINNLPITTTKGIIRLSDIAEIRQGYKDVYVRANMNGEECVMMLIRKQSGFNTVKVSNRVNAEMDKILKELDGVEVKTLFDQADFVKESLGSVTKNAVVGGILAIFVLFVFLKNIRSTLIVGVAIPVSIITTFILIYFSGITLNMMSLGGLALGIGMLVDSAIVVLESIYRYREEGYSRIDAAREGSNEVAMAVTASTLTTVAVFLPIAFIRDNMAIEMFRELALTVAFSLLASLIISLTLVPMLASKILKIDRNGGTKRKTPGAIIGRGFDKIMKNFEVKYEKLLHWSIGHRKTIVIGIVIMFALSIVIAVMFTGAEFFPNTDEGMFTIKVELPKGYSLNETSEIAAEVSQRIQEFNELDYIFVLEGDDGDPSTAVIYASFGSKSTREKGIDELLDETRGKLHGIAGAKISVDKYSMMNMGAGGKPITINIMGDDLETLQDIAETLIEEVSLVPGTREVSSSISQTIPEAQIKINREKASQYGISTYSLANTVQTAIMGQTVTRYKVRGEEIDVRLRLQEGWRSDLKDLEYIMITSPMGQQVPLYELADIFYDQSPASIQRTDQVRRVNVTGDISGRDPRSVFVDIQKKIDEMDIPNGYEVKLGGENEEMIEAAMAFGLALLLAILLVYMIMASQFESLLHPFIIMFTVPLAFIGISVAMALAGKPFSVPAFTGIIMLAGIVVNNAIVLVDYINTLRKRGMERTDAICKAGPIRLRPILMTTLTTVLGLIPLALGIGEGAEQQAPMAITVIGGLSFSTLLTLVFIPVIYTILDDFKNWMKKKVFRKKNTTINV